MATTPYPGEIDMKVPSLINRVRAWKRRSRISYELNSMSDHDLADIGITRGDIARVVQGRFIRGR